MRSSVGRHRRTGRRFCLRRMLSLMVSRIMFSIRFACSLTAPSLPAFVLSFEDDEDEDDRLCQTHVRCSVESRSTTTTTATTTTDLIEPTSFVCAPHGNSTGR